MRAGLDQKGPFAAPERAEEPPRPAAQKIHHDPVLTQITATPGRTDTLQRPPCTRTKLHFDTDSVRIQSGIISAGYGVGSDDLSPNSALFVSVIENVYKKNTVMEPQKQNRVSARCRGVLRFSVRDWIAGLSIPKGTFGSEFVP